MTKTTRTHAGPTKAERQTRLCNDLRERLQSIAIQAVQAQEHIGSDKCDDLLNDIERDVTVAQKMSSDLHEW